jgi:hypothetical protein
MLQLLRLIESTPQPRLFALFQHGPHFMSRYIGHQQLYRVGADVNNGATDGFHSATL